jgi:hypothetical protein
MTCNEKITILSDYLTHLNLALLESQQVSDYDWTRLRGNQVENENLLPECASTISVRFETNSKVIYVLGRPDNENHRLASRQTHPTHDTIT